MAESVELVSLSYPERQMIMVGDYAEITKVPLGAVNNWSTAKTVGAIALGVGAVGLALTGDGLLAETAGATLAAAASAGVTGVGAKLVTKNETSSSNDSVEGPVLLKVPAKLTQHIRWGMGHPRPNIIYIGHPANPSVYYPAPEFHQSIFDSKYGELMRILVALHPKEFTIHYEKGWRADGKLGASVDFLKGAFTGKEKMNFGANTKTDVLCNVSFQKPGLLAKFRKPVLPDDLVWLPYDVKWRALVESRINGIVKEFDLCITSNDHFGITADLGIAMKKKGIKAEYDGQYSQFRETVWRVKGGFW